MILLTHSHGSHPRLSTYSSIQWGYHTNHSNVQPPSSHTTCYDPSPTHYHCATTAHINAVRSANTEFRCNNWWIPTPSVANHHYQETVQPQKNSRRKVYKTLNYFQLAISWLDTTTYSLQFLPPASWSRSTLKKSFKRCPNSSPRTVSRPAQSQCHHRHVCFRKTITRKRTVSSSNSKSCNSSSSSICSFCTNSSKCVSNNNTNNKQHQCQHVTIVSTHNITIGFYWFINRIIESQRISQNQTDILNVISV